MTFSFGVISQEVIIDTTTLVESEIAKVHLVDIGFSAAFPVGVFKENVERTVLPGFNIGYYYQLKPDQPSFIGGVINYGYLGGVSRGYSQIIEDELIDIVGRMTSNSLGVYAVARYYPRINTGPIEIFIDGQFGGKLFYSYFSERGTFFNGEQYTYEEYLNRSWAWSYSGLIGGQIFLNDNIYFTFRGGYSGTVSTSYDKKIVFGPNEFALLPQDGFEMVRSAADVFVIDIGLTYVY